MTKVESTVVDFRSYIFADLTRHVISPRLSVCSNETNLTHAHSCRHSVEILTNHSSCFPNRFGEDDRISPCVLYRSQYE